MELGFADGNGRERGGLVSEARTGKRFPLELPIKIHQSEKGGEHKRDHLILRRIYSDGFRRDFIVAHGQKAAAVS